MALSVIDAGVLAALLDRNDACHDAACGRIRHAERQGEGLAVPATAYAALLVQPLVAGAAGERLVDALLHRLGAHIAPVDLRVARAAAALLASHPTLPVAGAYVLAAACALRATAVVTTARSWPRVRALGVPFRVERVCPGAPGGT